MEIKNGSLAIILQDDQGHRQTLVIPQAVDIEIASASGHDLGGATIEVDGLDPLEISGKVFGDHEFAIQITGKGLEVEDGVWNYLILECLHDEGEEGTQ